MRTRSAWGAIITVRSWSVRAALALLVLSAASSEAWAQRRGRGRMTLGPITPEFGVRGGYDTGRKSASFGGQLRVPVAKVLDIIPSGDFFFSGSDSRQYNLDAAIRLGRIQALYAGGGVGFAERGTGANVFVGAEAGRRLVQRPVHGFLELRWTLIDGASAHILLGVNVRLGAR